MDKGDRKKKERRKRERVKRGRDGDIIQMWRGEWERLVTGCEGAVGNHTPV